MFNQCIRSSELMLTSEHAGNLFESVGGDLYREDVTFVAVLRALLLKRIELGNNRVTFRNLRAGYTKYDYENNPFYRIFDAIFGSRNRSDTVYAVSVDNDDPEFALDCIRKNFKGLNRTGFNSAEELVDVEQYFEKLGITTVVFIVPEVKLSYIFVKRMTIKSYHAIQSFIPRYMPWYFKDKPLEAIEISLLESLQKKGSQSFIETMAAIADNFNLRETLIRSMLNGFEKRANRARLQSIERDIDNTNVQIDDIIANYRRLIKQLEGYRITQTGLKAIIAQGCESNELAEFFIGNKSVEIINTYEQMIHFHIKTYLVNFDPEMYSRFVDNNFSHIWNERDYSPFFREKAVRRKLMDALFSDEPVLKVRMCAYFAIDMRGMVDTERNHYFGDDYNSYIPNTHLNRHSCIGNNRPLIEERLRDGDPIGAIMQCIASAGSINIAEGVTFGPFLDQLFTTSEKVIELPDGKNVSPQEAVEWLNAQDPNSNENAEGGNE